jgi:hypothetical protein
MNWNGLALGWALGQYIKTVLQISSATIRYRVGSGVFETSAERFVPGKGPSYEGERS